MASSYYTISDGEWVLINGRRLRSACCDCGFVHDFHFAIRKGKIYYRCWRNPRATGGKRRAKGVKIVNKNKT